jgi:hypothetical protein
MKGTNKHMEDKLIRFETYRGLPPSEENKYKLTHSKDGTMNFLFLFLFLFYPDFSTFPFHMVNFLIYFI